MLKIKPKLGNLSRFELILHLTFYGVGAVILFSFILSLWFLYQKFYLTLTQAEEIIILKSQLAVEDLNVSLYTKIKNNETLYSKRELHNWDQLKNPFIQPLP